MDLFEKLSNNGNVEYLKSSINVQCSSQSDDPFHPLLTHNSNWESLNSQNSWYLITLLNDSFLLENYSITSNPKGNPDFPQSWILEGSNNGRKWTNISCVESSKLTDYGKTKNYIVKRKIPLRFFKFTMIGLNYAQDYQFCINRIYFYGQNITNNLFYKENSYENSSSNHVFFLFVILTFPK